MRAVDLAGTSLGNRTVDYGAFDAALYALAVGAEPTDLQLVYERDLRVLPTYATALGIWVTFAAAERGGYDVANVLHVGQTLELHAPLPPAATIEMTGRIGSVFDKGSAALVELVVESRYFSCTYRMYVRGLGGWGGDRGSSPRVAEVSMSPVRHWTIPRNVAVLYRLTGDPHPIHVDPVVARAAGLDGPIVHGLCTLGAVARLLAESQGVHPWDLVWIEAVLTSPVYPGDVLTVAAAESQDDGTVQFGAGAREAQVLRGTASFDRNLGAPR